MKAYNPRPACVADILAATTLAQPPTIPVIAKRAGYSTSQVTRVLDALRMAGRVTRRRAGPKPPCGPLPFLYEVTP